MKEKFLSKYKEESAFLIFCGMGKTEILILSSLNWWELLLKIILNFVMENFH